MFNKWRTDRRTRYSFPAHFRRVVETKGFGRVATSLVATAVVAGAVFANCSSSDITGPSARADVGATAEVVSTPTTGSGNTNSKQSPVKLPFTTVPPKSPCTGDDIVWDKMQSMIHGLTQISTGADGRLHIQFHLNSVATGSSLTRRYSGSEEYNSQTHTVESGSNNRMKFEWNMKIVARGEDGRLLPEDDFHLHVVSTFGPPPLFTLEEATALGECR